MFELPRKDTALENYGCGDTDLRLDQTFLINKENQYELLNKFTPGIIK